MALDVECVGAASSISECSILISPRTHLCRRRTSAMAWSTREMSECALADFATASYSCSRTSGGLLIAVSPLSCAARMGTFTVTGSGFGWSWGSDRSRHVGHRLALTVTRVPHKAHAQKNVDPKVPSPGRRVSYWGYPHEPIRGSAPVSRPTT